MRWWLVSLISFVLGGASAEAADAWTCTWHLIDGGDAMVRFEVATPDLIQTKGPTLIIPHTPPGTHFRILQNDDDGLVATFAASGLSEGHPYTGETSVVINKSTGEFVWAEAGAGAPENEPIDNETLKAMSMFVHGKCLHD